MLHSPVLFHKINLVILLLALSPLLKAQQSSNIQHSTSNLKILPPALSNAIEREVSSNKNIDFIVKGNATEIQKAVAAFNGTYKYGYGELSAIRLPANKIAAFLQQTQVQQIEYNESKGFPLNDLMKVNNNVENVHKGLGNLPQRYDGKGVLVGIIDGGIDVKHEDFKENGKTRIKYIWDQNGFPPKPPSPFGYGTYWTGDEIDKGICDNTVCCLDNQDNSPGHGTVITGIAAGNGLSVANEPNTPNYRGVAYKSDIVFVAINNNQTFLQNVADAVQFIFSKADELNQPCVINLSYGGGEEGSLYRGTKDGKELTVQLIDKMLNEKNGRVLVAAAGNGDLGNYHLGYKVTADTAFTWFDIQSGGDFAKGGSQFYLYADSVDFNKVEFAIGLDSIANYQSMGRTKFLNVLQLDTDYTDNTIITNQEPINDKDGNLLAYLTIRATLVRQTTYRIHLMINLVNTKNYSNYYWRLMTTGFGKFDVYSSMYQYLYLKTANIIELNLPDKNVLPEIVRYKNPDCLQQLAAGVQCSPSVISVANYFNRNSYIDMNDNVQTSGSIPGQIVPGSSHGPTRTGFMKPEIAATGSGVMATGDSTEVARKILNGKSYKVGKGGKHFDVGGTSSASPVVAGVVALYLQKCPNASLQEVRNALFSTATRDNYTDAQGTGTCDYTWGYGKVNALAALESSNITIVLNHPPENNLCEGDTMMLIAPDGFVSYLWNTGSTEKSIVVNKPNDYFVTVTGANGCENKSPITKLINYPKITKPKITVYNDVLLSDSGNFYQWYLNGNAIAGAVERPYIAKQDGDYFVKVSDNNDCSAVSDNYKVTISSIENYDIPKLFNIYPNPFNDVFTVEFYNYKNTKNKITITNVLGQTVYSTSNLQGFKNLEDLTHIEINLQNQPKGVYFFKIENEKTVVVKKIIKQ